jgi:hypothetical protein
MTAWLTLASKDDCWPMDGGFPRLRHEGRLWLLVCPRNGPGLLVLKPHVADWCFENIGAYRIVLNMYGDHPSGHDTLGSWLIEFQRDGDMFLFNSEWGEQL